MKRIFQAFARQWTSRQDYATRRDFVLALYSWLLYHTRRWPLPWRDRFVYIKLAGQQAPFLVRLGGSDLPVLREIFVDGEYSSVVTALDEVNSIVDLGANVGLSLRYWHEHYPRALVIAVEPDDTNVDMLRRNVSLGGGIERLHVVQACVGATNRRTNLDRTGDPWAYRLRADANSVGDTRVCDMLTLLQETNAPLDIDLLKIDIEGAESEIFSNCSAWLRRVRNIVIEVHRPYTSAALLRDIKQAGLDFDMRILHGGASQQVLLLRRRQESISLDA